MTGGCKNWSYGIVFVIAVPAVLIVLCTPLILSPFPNKQYPGCILPSGSICQYQSKEFWISILFAFVFIRKGVGQNCYWCQCYCHCHCPRHRLIWDIIFPWLCFSLPRTTTTRHFVICTPHWKQLFATIRTLNSKCLFIRWIAWMMTKKSIFNEI